MERVSGLTLDQLLKHHLVKEYMGGIENMCVKKFLPLCAAILYPFSKIEIKKDSQSEYILSIINAIKKVAQKKEGLENYTLEGLRNLFEYKWLPTLDYAKQKQLIKGVSLIGIVEDDGFFSLNGTDKVYETFLNRPVLDISNNYGNVSFEMPDDDANSDAESIEDSNSINTNLEEEISLEPLKTFLWDSKLSGLNTNSRFFWEYKLSKEQYDKLKGILNGLNLGSNTRLLGKEIAGYGTVARIVALFVSEWYKRECPTLDGDMCLEPVALRGESKPIWIRSGFPDAYLHQGDDNYQMRQMAMCALGGLPLRIVNASPRFKNLVNGLCEIYQKGEAADEDIENVVNSFDDGNGVFKRSLVSGSCKKYLVQLVKYLESGKNSDLPFNKDDINESPFSDFVNQLKEGWDNELPKRYFMPEEVRIWTYDYFEDGDDSSRVESEFYIHIGFQKSKNVITKRELSKLGVSIPNDITTFRLRLKTTNNDGAENLSDEFRTYFKIGNNCEDFCGAFGSDIATNIDLFNTSEVSLWIEWEGNKQKIEKWSYKFPHYFQLYSTDYSYLWTTKKNKAARQVLFYDTKYYTPQNEDDLDIQIKSSGDNTCGWVYLKDNITLLGRGVEDVRVTIDGSELIAVDFRTKELRKNIELNAEGYVEKSIIDSEDGGPVPLLYYSHHKNLMLTCDGEKDDVLRQNYKIEFKSLNERNYQEWTADNHPSQGFLELRITCNVSERRKKRWFGTVYFIPECGPIVSRNLDNNFIYFKTDYICPVDNTLEQFSRGANESYKYRFKDGPDCGLDSSTISFRIGEDNNHIIVDVYRAFHWRQIMNNGSRIKDIINSTAPPPVAIILQKGITINVVDQDGSRKHSAQPSEFLDYFDVPRRIATSFINVENNAYKRYIYLDCYEDMKTRKVEIIDNSLILNVSNDYVDQYVFYYWSGEKEDNPIKLVYNKLKDRKYEYYIPFRLTDKAVVFQSLKDCIPNFYFRPFYADENLPWQYYIGRYRNNDISYLIKCYQLAAEHGVYFCIFPALRVLQDRGKFTDFIKVFVQSKNYHLSNEDPGNLTRLAKELAMDWFFVDRKGLFRELDDESTTKMRECMKDLLQNSPIKCPDGFLDIFLQSSATFNVGRSRGDTSNFLRAINNFSNYNSYEHIENRIQLLNELSNTNENIFSRIREILNI